MFDNMAQCRRGGRDGKVGGLCESEAYHQLGSNPSPDGTYWLSLVYHSDAAAVQQGGLLKFHPVQFAVAELPFALQQAWKCSVLAANYVGVLPADVARLLWPVLDQLQLMESVGFLAQTVKGVVRFKVRVFHGVMDLIERAKILNMQTFKGRFGCSLCEIESTTLYNGGTRCTAYIHTRRLKMRTPLHYRQHYQMAGRMQEGDDPVKGFKPGTMPFPPLAGRMPWSVPIDAMHLCYLGNMKYLLQFITTSQQRYQRSYLSGARLQAVDDVIASKNLVVIIVISNHVMWLVYLLALLCLM